MTIEGVFTILEKRIRHFSNIYDNAPMPFMERLTWGGVALHGADLPGYPASHGCIRLPREFARLLFAETRLGMTVMIVQSDAAQVLSPAIDPLPVPQSSALPYVWLPERSPSGQMTLLLSAADHRLLVVRNGREIGTAQANVDGSIDRARLFVLEAAGADDGHWTQLPLPGQDIVAVPFRLEDIHVDETFRALVVAAVEPGTTMVVTGDSFTPAAASPGRAKDGE